MHFSMDSASTSSPPQPLATSKSATKRKSTQQAICRRPTIVTQPRQEGKNEASIFSNNVNNDNIPRLTKCSKLIYLFLFIFSLIACLEQSFAAIDTAARRSAKHPVVKRLTSKEMMKSIENLFDQEPIDADILFTKLPKSAKKSRRHARHVRRALDTESKSGNNGNAKIMALLLMPIPRDERMLLNEVENAMTVVGGSTTKSPVQEESIQGPFDIRKNYDELEDGEEVEEDEEEVSKKKGVHQFFPIHISAVQRRSFGNRRSVHPCRWKLCGAYHNYQNGFRLFTK